MNRRVAVCALAIGLAAMAPRFTNAAQTRQEANARLRSIIERHLQAQDRVNISAETITLTGDTLRLKGNAWVRFGDGAVRADEVVINQATKRVGLLGTVRAVLGSAASKSMPAPSPPVYK